MTKRTAPIRFDWKFHPNKVEYSQHSLERGLSDGVETPEDAVLIVEFETEIRSARGVSDGRVNKLTSALVTWLRHPAHPYKENLILSISQRYNGSTYPRKIANNSTFMTGLPQR